MRGCRHTCCGEEKGTLKMLAWGLPVISERILDGHTVPGGELRLDITFAGPPVRDDVFDFHTRTAV